MTLFSLKSSKTFNNYIHLPVGWGLNASYLSDDCGGAEPDLFWSPNCPDLIDANTLDGSYRFCAGGGVYELTCATIIIII